MMRGKDVRPRTWSNVLDLYDDGDTSFISGNYKNAQETSIGIRWDGNPDDLNDAGYPNQGKNPTWFILPEWLRNPVLAVLTDRVKKDATIGDMPNIKKAFDLIN